MGYKVGTDKKQLIATAALIDRRNRKSKKYTFHDKRMNNS
jgi:hypothetical protein